MHILLILGIIWLLLMCCTDPETRWEVVLILGVLFWLAAQHTPNLTEIFQ